MGTIKTTNIEPIANNGTVTLGSSGDTFTVPSGVTVNMSSATQTGVGGVNTPSFSAYDASNQTIPNTTYTLLEFDTKSFDTDSAYNTSTYKFTVPSGKGGKYYLFSSVLWDFEVAGDDGFEAEAFIYKNGSAIKGSRFRNNTNFSFFENSLE